MGCGTLDWADLFDHVSELLSDEADAPVREHLASCDACRADSGELMVLSEEFWALGILTHVTGREAFADRARSEVRELMGDKASVRSTGAWRAISSAESQRMRRSKLRRRAEIKQAMLVSAAVAALLSVGVVALFYFGGVAYLVDTSGVGIEDTLGIDLAEWGLRQRHEQVAELARAAKGTEDLRALSGSVWRQLRRELSSPFCRVSAVLYLEFAHTLALQETLAARELIAAAVLAAERAEKPPEPVRPELLGVVRKARGLWRNGRAAAAQEVLLIPVTEEEPLALYYSGLILAETEGWEKGAPLLSGTADRFPAVRNEIAWRRLRSDEPDLARKALTSAPEGKVREALAALLAAKKR